MTPALHRFPGGRAIPPGPRGYPLVGVFPKARRDPPAFLLDAARAHGDVVSIPMGPRRVYLLNHPEHIERVLKDGDRVCQKGAAAARIGPLFGESLTTIDGERWLRRRRALRPAFAPQRLAALVPAMVEETSAMLDRWSAPVERGEPLDVLGEMTALTRAIILRALFGAVTPAEARILGEALDVVVEHVDDNLWSALGWLERLPTQRSRRYRAALRTLDDAISRRIASAGRGEGETGALLGPLLEARGEERLTVQELGHEAKALLVAGHTTTASALAWAWHLLSQAPEAWGRLRREADAVLGARSPLAADLPRLDYSRMVVEETLRHYPPTWVTARTTLADVEIGGYVIPAGAIVLLSPYVTHRDPRFWEDPERFDPERFAVGRSAGRRRFAYFPFGGGPRACIGSALASMEMQLIVAMVAQRYRFARAAGSGGERPLAGITLRPHGLRMIARPVGA